MDDLDKQIEADYQRDKMLIKGSVTARDIYSLAWLRGRGHGKDEGMKSTLSPEDAVRLENVTIGESFRHNHFASVLEAQRQSG